MWYQTRHHEQHLPEWEEAPRLLEDTYSVTDAVVFGSLLIALLRHADRVTVACLAQLVNVIAPILTEPGGPTWRQTTFFPFAQASKYGRGRVLQATVDSPTHETKVYGEVASLHATAVLDEETDAVTVFAVNRDQHRPLPLLIDLRGLAVGSVAEHTVLSDADPEARNTLAEPDRVRPHPAQSTVIEDGSLMAASWDVIVVGGGKDDRAASGGRRTHRGAWPSTPVLGRATSGAAATPSHGTRGYGPPATGSRPISSPAAVTRSASWSILTGAASWTRGAQRRLAVVGGHRRRTLVGEEDARGAGMSAQAR